MSKTPEKPVGTPQKRGGAQRGPKMPTSPPPDLDYRSKRFWADTLELLQRQGNWSNLYVPVLERNVRSCQKARVFEAKIPDEGTTHGSQGQLVEHPAIKTVREAERDADKYGRELFSLCEVKGEALSEDDFDELLRGG